MILPPDSMSVTCTKDLYKGLDMGFPKLGYPFGVLIIGIQCVGDYWGPPIYGNYHVTTYRMLTAGTVTSWWKAAKDTEGSPETVFHRSYFGYH